MVCDRDVTLSPKHCDRTRHHSRHFEWSGMNPARDSMPRRRNGAIECLIERKTGIVIAHRFFTVRRANLIVTVQLGLSIGQ
jgi:hypothetical protein